MAKRQTTQWPKEKGQKDKQISTKHTNKTRDQVTRPPLKTGDVLKGKTVPVPLVAPELLILQTR